jgi:hypothetical protein
MTTNAPSSVPRHIANAIATLTMPSRFECFIRAYGDGDRAKFEWEGSLPQREETRDRDRAQKAIDSARAVCAENGWEWGEVERLSRELYPNLFKGEQ